MIWLNKLLRKPDAPASAPTAGARPAPVRRPAPVMDIPALRAALAQVATADDAALAGAQHALGGGLGAQLQAPLADDAPAVWAAAVAQVPNRALALQWLDQLTSEALLAQVAREARFAEVRLAAAQRITDTAILDALARSVRDKDKGVYRHCSDLLRQRKNEGLRAQSALTLAAELDRLLETAPLSVSRLLELEREMRDLGETTPALAECRARVASANARVLEEAAQRRSVQNALAQAEALLGRLAAAAAADTADATAGEAASLAASQAEILSLQAAQDAVPAWMATEAAARALPTVLAELGLRLTALQDAQAREAQRQQALEAARQQAQALAVDTPVPATPGKPETTAAEPALPAPDGGTAPTRTDTATSADASGAVPDGVAATAESETTFSAKGARKPGKNGKAAAAPGPEAPPLDLDAVRSQLETLEHALDEGQLLESDQAERLLKDTLGSAELSGALDARVQRARGRLGELRGWAAWGANKKREDLIEAAQQLLVGDPVVEHLAVAIPALREEWKRLNVQGPSSKAQWDSFDGALTRAYQPVAVLRAEEAARRAAARAAKEALLAQWEASVAAIAWDHADFAAVDLQRQQMLNDWRAAPLAGFREERSLRKRLDTLIAQVDAQVEQARASEVQRRQQLISAAQALVEQTDLRRSTTEAKALQERWRTEVGPLKLPRGIEQKLWREFRAACDAVFARRDTQRAQETAERDQRNQARTALLEGFAAQLDGDAAQIRRALAQFRTDWEGSGEPGTSAPAAAVPERGGRTGRQDGAARAGRAEAGGHRDAGARAPADARTPREGRDARGGRPTERGAGPQARPERLDPHDREALRLQQQAQARLQALRQDAYRARLEALAQTRAATQGLDEQTLAAGHERRSGLLIDMEIALGLPGPGDHADARRRRQLEHLQGRFRNGAAPSARPEELLAQWYATAAPEDESFDARLRAIVNRLVEQDSGARA